MNLKEIEFLVFDFDGVFTDNRVIVSEDGKESVVCNRSDGIGLSMLKRVDLPMMILSTEVNNVVQQRAKKLKLECINGCENKLETLKNISEERGFELSKIAYLGNDINDLECLENVGFSFCVKDSYPEVIAVSDMVLESKGGEGAVRELCELIYESKIK